MTIDLNEYLDIKYNKVLCKRLLKGELYEYESDFVDNFLACAKMFGWTWTTREINRENVVDSILEFSYNLMKFEMDYFVEHGKWKEDDFVSRTSGSGRIEIVCTDFEVDEKHAWLDLGILCSL